MRSEVRALPEAEHTVWWLLLCRAVEQRVRAALAARAEPSRCPHIRSSGTGEWATNWCALAEQPALHEAARLALDALEESRDDVNEAINSILHGEGYPSFDRRIKQAREQLARHDAAIAALRAALDAARRDGGEG